MSLKIQAKRIRGDEFTAEDVLLVNASNADFGKIESITYTVEMVSGADVLHGGGGEPGTYLHYKNPADHTFANGVINYANSEMYLTQTEQGTAVIKVVAEYLTTAKAKEFEAAVEAAANAVDGENSRDEMAAEGDAQVEVGASVDMADYKQYAKTGEITLSWSEDDWV